MELAIHLRARQAVTRSATSRARLAGVDLLRLVAVLLVLGRHMVLPPESWSTASRGFFSTWQRGGWVGVDLFFVVSGFLVSGLLFTEFKSRGRMTLVRFYTRRGWKIYPPFFVLMAITIIAAWWSGRAIPRPQLAAELLFLQSYLPGVWTHTWSLAVEEHFYLLLPLALILIHTLNKRSAMPLEPVFRLAVWIAVVTLGARIVHWYFNPSYTYLTHHFASHLRLDSLFCGVAISYAYHFHAAEFESLKRWRWPMLVGGCLLLSPAFVFKLETTPFLFTLGFTLFYVASGMILVAVLLSDVPRNRVVRFAAAVGACSYSIYLWHLYVASTGVRLVERALGAPMGFWAATATYMLGALAVGAFMARAVEFPALRLRDRWFPARDLGAVKGQDADATHPDVDRVVRAPASDGIPLGLAHIEEPIEASPPRAS
jgi:peptidoglycan/LPS O-acetylase OafA/YrhL